MSAKCCSLIEKVVETREGENVMTATAFDNLTTLFKDLTKESISHSYIRVGNYQQGQTPHKIIKYMIKK